MGVKISELTSMGALAGTEKLAGVGTGTQYTTPADMKTYIGITSPVAWTPTFTGFGTVSGVTAYSWRVGSCLFFEIRFTSGTSTATEARISLGYNGTDGNVTTASTYPALQAVGYGGSDTGTSPFVMLAEASKTYLTIGIQDGSGGTRAGISKRNGDALMASGWVFSVSGNVRIQGW